MRLINADDVLSLMERKFDMQDSYLPIHFKELIIDEIPTAYDIEKVKTVFSGPCKECNWKDTGRCSPKNCIHAQNIKIVETGGDYRYEQ